MAKSALVPLAAVITLLSSNVLAQAPGTVIAADKRVQARSYVFAETGERLPYAVFVPSNYDATKQWPLIVGLHGWGRPYDWVMGYDGIVDFAERDGFIMVTPLGYRSTGWFGAPLLPPPPSTRPPAAGRTAAQEQALTKEVESLPPNIRELSEKDVMHVVEIVRKDFTIDPSRIYLWGHSMGGSGTFHLAARYPDIWAALAVAAPGPGVELDELRTFRHIPILVLQGDADQTVMPAWTRGSVTKMKQLGMECLYVEIRGGDHSLFISKNRDTLSKIFSFFNIVRKGDTSARMTSTEISYPQVYAAPDGETHFREVKVALTAEAAAPPAQPVPQSELQPATTIRHAVLPPGWGIYDRDHNIFHNASSARFVTLRHGAVWIKTSDGDTRRFQSGDVLEVLDVAPSKGHITWVDGEEPVVQLYSNHR